MKIQRFIGRSVNRNLNFDISFDDRLTFVTGINGSGKTSALNSIAALLLPRLDYLATLYFEELTIKVSDEEGEVRLYARKTDSATELKCSRFPDDTLEFIEPDELESMSLARAREYEEEYYSNILSRNATNPILHFIESLPAPMYLGLDRRSLSTAPDRIRHRPHSMSGRRHRRNIFGRSLEAGLNEAIHFARERYQEDRRRELALDERFRKTLVLALIDFPLFSLSVANLSEPSDDEISKIDKARSQLARLPKLLDVEKNVLSEQLDPMFAFLHDKLEIIKGTQEGADKDDQSRTEGEKRTIALIEWSYNKTNLDKIVRLSEIISKYTREANAIRQHRNSYLQSVNAFMRDSGKEILLNNIGELRFRVDNEEQERHIDTLSSGEIQLVVILTHLYFNREVEKANVFIIDEPELSLHVQWQEKFIDSILEASTERQFILATHSPSIILEKTDRCVDLGKK